MTAARHIVSPAIWGLALLLTCPAIALAQEMPGKVVMPWNKPKAQPPENFSDVLPWLLNGGSSAGKTTAQPSQWQTSVEGPSEPAEPTVTEFHPAEGRRLETGTISPSGLVLKRPLPSIPVKSDGKTKFKASTAAELDQAAGAGKIKNSVALPGDHPVGQATAAEIPSTASDVAAPAAADEAAAIAPDLAPPVPADEAASPRPAEQHAQAGAPSEGTALPADADFSVATPGGMPGETAASASPQLSPAHSGDTKFSPLRPLKAMGAHVKANAGVPGSTAGQVVTPAAATAPSQQAEVAPAVPASSSGATAVGAGEPVRVTAPHRTETAQVVPSAPVEAAPGMPQAEEAPAIPDPLPEAVVTPVAKPVTADLPVQQAKELSAPGPANSLTDPAKATAAQAGMSPAGKPGIPERLGEGASVAQQYCFNIADAAKDARYAWQKKTLADIEAELKKRIALLDERTAEYQKWLARRDEFIRNAEENVVKIYAGMAADAAAVQLTMMNEEAAAAVLAKLKTRNASAILNVMEPGKAAKLTMIITGAAKLKRKKELEKSMTTQGANAASGAPAPVAQAQGGRS